VLYKDQDRRGGEDFRGDPECQQRDGEVIDNWMQVIRADKLSRHDVTLTRRQRLSSS
jgi:hypothetical protein